MSSMKKFILLFTCIIIAHGVLSQSIAQEMAPIAEAASPVIITDPNLPTGTVGQTYSIQLESTGGKAPIRFGYQRDSFQSAPGCTGLNFSETGLIRGKLFHEGRCRFIAFVVDSSTPAIQSMPRLYLFKVLPKIERSLTSPPQISIERSISK